jgi:uncharacterized membrane protein
MRLLLGAVRLPQSDHPTASRSSPEWDEATAVAGESDSSGRGDVPLGPRSLDRRDTSQEGGDVAKDSQLILAFFETEASADTAAASLRQWAKTNRNVQLDAVGVLVKDDKGEVKTHKLGPHETGKGAGIGMALGVVAAVASGGLTLFEGLAIGGLSGGGIGFLFRKGLGMSDEDAARIADRLDAGHAAVGILAIPAQAPALMEKLEELGGEPESHEVSSDDLRPVGVGAT